MLLILVLLGLVLSIGFLDVVELILKLIGADVGPQVAGSFIERMPLSLVYVFLFLNLLVAILAVYKEKFFLENIQKALFYIKEAFVHLFKGLTFPETVVMIVIPLLSAIYFASSIPVSYDEAATYNYFTVKPFYFSMIFYPYPNNHVLHSLFTNLTEYIPFLSPLFSIRIPVLFASLFTWLIAYSFIKKYYNSNTALLIVGLVSAMYMSIYYSFMSRGYAFMVLAFIVCMYATFNIISKGDRSKDWMFFVISGALGCYAIPSFLYPFATLNVIILFYNYKNIKKQVIWNMLAGSLVILLYAPIMIVDGIAALTSNQFVQSVDRFFIVQNIFYFCQAMIAEIVGGSYTLIMLIYVLFIPLAYAIYRRDKKYILLWFVFMLAPFALLFLHAVNPFYRTFLYYNFIVAFLLVVPFSKLLNKAPKIGVLIFILSIQAVGVYSFNGKIAAKEGFNTDVSKVVKTYFKTENKILFPCIASENYKFEAKVQGLESQIDFYENKKVNVDTVSTVYDYVIVEKKRDQTQIRQPYASSNSQNIYKNGR